MTEAARNRFHAIVKGRVQGVSFRYFVQEQAEHLGISGWVRNLWNGSVEVTAEGSQQNLETFIQALHVGPPMARVDEVKVEWQTFNGEFNGFQVRGNSTG